MAQSQRRRCYWDWLPAASIQTLFSRLPCLCWFTIGEEEPRTWRQKLKVSAAWNQHVFMSAVLPLIKEELVNGYCSHRWRLRWKCSEWMFADDLAAEIEEDKVKHANLQGAWKIWWAEARRNVWSLQHKYRASCCSCQSQRGWPVLAVLMVCLWAWCEKSHARGDQHKMVAGLLVMAQLRITGEHPVERSFPTSSWCPCPGRRQSRPPKLRLWTGWPTTNCLRAGYWPLGKICYWLCLPSWRWKRLPTLLGCLLPVHLSLSGSSDLPEGSWMMMLGEARPTSYHSLADNRCWKRIAQVLRLVHWWIPLIAFEAVKHINPSRCFEEFRELRKVVRIW